MKILSDQGFKNFEGFISQGKVSFLYRFSFSRDSFIDCTKDHKFLLDDGTFKEAELISVEDTLYPNISISNKEKVHFPEGIEVYDAFNVEDAHNYLTNGVISHNCNLVMLDEFGFVDNATEFYTSTYPVISSGTSTKMIVTSTPNGVGNMFHRIWEGATQEVNDFKSFRVHWWDVPGRDEEWKRQTVANTSDLQFSQEHECNFLGTGNTLIDPETLINLRAKNPIETRGQMKVYEKPKNNHEYVAMVDVSHGGGGDYSVINIIDVSDNPFKQVAVYRNNRIPPLLFPTEIVKWAKAYNEAMVIVESNDQGTVVANGLYYDLEYPNMFVESAVKANGIGLNMTKKTKLVGCSGLKQILETSKLEIVDADTIDELSTFEVRGNSFAASDGNHDDIVMTLVSFGHFISTQFFSDMTDINLREFLYKKRMREIEEDIVPFGHIDNGVNNFHEAVQVPRTGGWMIDEERSFF